MSINKRIKEIRKDAKLNQTEFGEKLGVSRSVIANIELDLNKTGVQESIIKLISCIFGVNEDWIKTGAGAKYSNTKASLKELAEECSMSALEYTILLHYLNLDEKQRKAVQKFAINLSKEISLYVDLKDSDNSPTTVQEYYHERKDMTEKVHRLEEKIEKEDIYKKGKSC